MSSWTIYWITRLDAIREGMCPIIVIGLVAGFVAVVVALIRKVNAAGSYIEKECPPLTIEYRVIAIGAVVALLSGSIRTLTPTTKEMCAIIAIPAIVNSEDAQEISSEVVDLAKDWLKELKPTPSPETPNN